MLYDFARRKGFVEIAGSGWRKQRSDAPLVNTYRSWCDARGVPAIYVFKGSGEADEVLADLSPLRTPLQFEAAAAFCLESAADGAIEFSGGMQGEASDEEESAAPPPQSGEMFELAQLEDAYRNEPIYRVPMYAIAWLRPRGEAKQLAKQLAERLGTPQQPKGKAAAKGRSKERGAPKVKPGKSRRHGGYGIG